MSSSSCLHVLVSYRLYRPRICLPSVLLLFLSPGSSKLSKLISASCPEHSPFQIKMFLYYPEHGWSLRQHYQPYGHAGFKCATSLANIWAANFPPSRFWKSSHLATFTSHDSEAEIACFFAQFSCLGFSSPAADTSIHRTVSIPLFFHAHRTLLVICFIMISCLVHSLTVNTEICAPETSVNFNWATWRYNPGERTLQM